jgi:hypothetical protein
LLIGRGGENIKSIMRKSDTTCAVVEANYAVSTEHGGNDFWICPRRQCGNHNFVPRTHCYGCDTAWQHPPVIKRTHVVVTADRDSSLHRAVEMLDAQRQEWDLQDKILREEKSTSKKARGRVKELKAKAKRAYGARGVAKPLPRAATGKHSRSDGECGSNSDSGSYDDWQLERGDLAAEILAEQFMSPHDPMAGAALSYLMY